MLTDVIWICCFSRSVFCVIAGENSCPCCCNMVYVWSGWFRQLTKDLHMTPSVGCASRYLILIGVSDPISDWFEWTEGSEWTASWSSGGVALISSLSLSRVGSFMSFLPVYFLFCCQTIFQCELRLLLPLLIVPFPVSGCDDILN